MLLQFQSTHVAVGKASRGLLVSEVEQCPELPLTVSRISNPHSWKLLQDCDKLCPTSGIVQYSEQDDRLRMLSRNELSLFVADLQNSSVFSYAA